MFSCFGSVEEEDEEKPWWKGVASAFKKKLRSIKRSKESSSSPTTYNSQVIRSRNLAAINHHRLEHFRQYCEHYHELHHPGSRPMDAKAHSAAKRDAVRPGLINIHGGRGHVSEEEVDIRAEEFIKNMKMRWSLEKQQSADSIDSISSQ